MDKDIRWLQRYEHFKSALAQLDSALGIERPSVVERAGMIQIFEFTAELAWNTLKDFLEYQGETNISGSRDAISLAFKAGLVSDGRGWLNMLKSRNLSSHIYDEEVAEEILAAIRESYLNLFHELRTLMADKVGD
jgi:nucleotidyltransferase substrate binding protein (TIGR01987 family)